MLRSVPMAGIFRELHAAIVPVSDFERARRWYEEVLELRPRKVLEGFLVVYDTGGPTHLCLYVPDVDKERPGYQDGGAFPNWRAEDIDETHRTLLERGVRCTPVQRGPGLAWFTFYDPDGNRYDVCAFGSDWMAE